ncbi:hypothetical protein KA050_01060 [Candidatus Gracilibacteria bacterium]|nr:hypothetical protein [Candidatus Gracilibacteria bacterium]
MKTPSLFSIVAAATLSSCVVPPPQQINYTERGDIFAAGRPVHGVMDNIPYSPPGTVNIPIEEWARFQNLQYQQKLRDAENQAFAEKHLRGW